MVSRTKMAKTDGSIFQVISELTSEMSAEMKEKLPPMPQQLITIEREKYITIEKTKTAEDQQNSKKIKADESQKVTPPQVPDIGGWNNIHFGIGFASGAGIPLGYRFLYELFVEIPGQITFRYMNGALYTSVTGFFDTYYGYGGVATIGMKFNKPNPYVLWYIDAGGGFSAIPALNLTMFPLTVSTGFDFLIPSATKTLSSIGIKVQAFSQIPEYYRVAINLILSWNVNF